MDFLQQVIFTISSILLSSYFVFGYKYQSDFQKYEWQQLQAAQAKINKLPVDICGEPSETVFEKKIINGDPADLGAYPWMAAIGYTANSEGPFWNCGGSLITDQYVLTAAHCLDPTLIQKKRPFVASVVRLGDLNLDDKIKDGATPLDIEVEKVVFHSQYDNTKKINDIGLIRMKRKVQFHDMLKPICLPPPEFATNSFVDYASVVIGWGRTSFGASGRTTQLQEAEVQIKDIDECRKNITTVFPRSVIDNSVVCASAFGKDSCQGDSGGPLMLFRRHRNKARMFLLGVVSYGYSCAAVGFPGIYTRVPQHMRWIMESMDL